MTKLEPVAIWAHSHTSVDTQPRSIHPKPFPQLTGQTAAECLQHGTRLIFRNPRRRSCVRKEALAIPGSRRVWRTMLYVHGPVLVFMADQVRPQGSFRLAWWILKSIFFPDIWERKKKETCTCHVCCLGLEFFWINKRREGKGSQKAFLFLHFIFVTYICKSTEATKRKREENILLSSPPVLKDAHCVLLWGK